MSAQGRTRNQRLIELRQRRGWTQEKLARELSAAAVALDLNASPDRVQISRWENGWVPWPSPTYRTLLEAVFGLPTDQLGFLPPYAEAEANPEHLSGPSALGAIERARAEAYARGYQAGLAENHRASASTTRRLPTPSCRLRHRNHQRE